MAKTYFHWDPIDDCVTHESDGAGNTIVTYDREPGQFGPLISETRNGATYTHHYDALGSTTVMTNDAGTVTDTFQYDAWGVVSRTGTTPSPYQWVGRIGYHSGDEQTGFYVRNRVYSSAIARWCSVDPAEFLDSLNRFVVSVNSPVLVLDPTGLLITWRRQQVLSGIWELNYESGPMELENGIMEFSYRWKWRTKEANIPPRRGRIAAATQYWQLNRVTLIEIEARTCLPWFNHTDGVDVVELKKVVHGNVDNVPYIGYGDTQGTVPRQVRFAFLLDVRDITGGFDDGRENLPNEGTWDMTNERDMVLRMSAPRMPFNFSQYYIFSDGKELCQCWKQITGQTKCCLPQVVTETLDTPWFHSVNKNATRYGE